MKVLCIGWNLSRKELETLNNTADYIRDQLPGVEVVATDGYRHTITLFDEYISFGKNAEHACEKDPWKMPCVKELAKKREEAKRELAIIIDGLRMIWTERQDEIIVQVQKDEVTVGTAASDIQVSDTELEYLKGLKKLLNGSKMIISKGDIRIEVE